MHTTLPILEHVNRIFVCYFCIQLLQLHLEDHLVKQHIKELVKIAKPSELLKLETIHP